jgi:hypothetical protein
MLRISCHRSDPSRVAARRSLSFLRFASRLEQQQHPAREISVGVCVEPDMSHEAVDVEGHAEYGLRPGLAVVAPEVLVCERHGSYHVGVVVGELTSDDDGPVIVAALRQLTTCPRAEDDHRDIWGDLAVGQRTRLGVEFLRGVRGRIQEMGEPRSRGFL